MNLLFPAFLGGAALVGIPLLLHFLRRQSQRQMAFPSLRFLGMSALQDSRRHQLRRWIVLALRCLLMLAVVAAFARPFKRLPHSGQSRAVIVVVDNSYSMQARDRAETVQGWLEPHLAALRPPDEIGVLVMRPTPTWLLPLGRDLDRARAALSGLPTGFHASRYRPSLDLAATRLQLAHAPIKQILVAGDQQRLGWQDGRFDRPLASGIDLVAAPVAPNPIRQAAVTGLRVVRQREHRLIFDAMIAGFGRETHPRAVTFHAGETRLGAVACTITPGAVQRVHFEATLAGGDAALAMRASLDPDELPADDTAYAALPAIEDQRVALLTANPSSEPDYLAQALAAATRSNGLATFRVEPAPKSGTRWPDGAVAIVRGSEPFVGASRTALESCLAGGGSAWIMCDGSPEQAAWLANSGVTVQAAPAPRDLGPLALRDFALEHALFEPFRGYSLGPLFELRFNRGWSLAGAVVEPLAHWADGSTAIAEVPVGSGRVLVTGFDATRAVSDWPLHAAFVPLAHQAVTWLTQHEQDAQSGRVGVALPLPGAGTWRRVLGPGRDDAVTVEHFMVPDAPGVFEFVEGNHRQLWAVNLDPAESNLESWPTPADFNRLIAPKQKPPAASVAGTHPLSEVAPELLVDEGDRWWWLIAAAVLLLLVELGFANRTVP